MIRGVVFDLDGTLIDSMGIWYEIDRAFLRENGITEPPENISDIMKRMSVEECSEYFVNEFGLDITPEYAVKRIEELVRIEYEEKIALKPFVHELLEYLDEKGIPYGVATATYKNMAEAVLRRHGILDRFRFVLTDFEYPMGKNDPAIFLGAARMLGTLPSETAVFEDSLHCIESAAGAGFFTVGIYDEHSASDSEGIRKAADRFFTSLSEAFTLFG